MAEVGTPGPWVLLAEDDDDLRRVLSECIEEGGFSVTGVATGSALWDELRTAIEANATPAVVIADERMPGLSGSTVLARARALGCSKPLVLMTAFWDREVLVRARRLGAAVLTKPVELADLLGLLSWSLRLQTSEHDPHLRCSACGAGQNVRPTQDDSDVMFCRDCRDATEKVDLEEAGVGD